jgi:hypothetical protein
LEYYTNKKEVSSASLTNEKHRDFMTPIYLWTGPDRKWKEPGEGAKQPLSLFYRSLPLPVVRYQQKYSSAGA